MLKFIETLRIENGIIHNLDYHNARLNLTRRQNFNSKDKIDLKDFADAFQDIKGRMKCRVLYSENDYEVSYEMYKRRSINTIKLVFDDKISYEFKSENRSDLNDLYVQKENCDEILIVKNGFITDTSYTNAAFFDGARWFTPENPLLAGTKRQELLDKQIIIPQKIKVKDLSDYQRISLINSMLDLGEIMIDIGNIF